MDTLLLDTNDEDNNNQQRRCRCKRKVILLFNELMKRTTFRGRCLNEEGRERRARKIPRESLVDPVYSPWNRLYFSKNDQALITVTGFDHVSFKILLRLFAPEFLVYTPWTGNNDGMTYKKLKRKGGIDYCSCLPEFNSELVSLQRG